jgi:hypothetical protein
LNVDFNVTLKNKSEYKTFNVILNVDLNVILKDNVNTKHLI